LAPFDHCRTVLKTKKPDEERTSARGKSDAKEGRNPTSPFMTWEDWYNLSKKSGIREAALESTFRERIEAEKYVNLA